MLYISTDPGEDRGVWLHLIKTDKISFHCVSSRLSYDNHSVECGEGLLLLELCYIVLKANGSQIPQIPSQTFFTEKHKLVHHPHHCVKAWISIREYYSGCYGDTNFHDNFDSLMKF